MHEATDVPSEEKEQQEVEKETQLVEEILVEGGQEDEGMADVDSKPDEVMEDKANETKE